MQLCPTVMRCQDRENKVITSHQGNDTTVYIQATGDTSVEETEARLKDDECQYGLIKAVGVDPQGRRRLEA